MLRFLFTCFGAVLAVFVVTSCTDNEQVIPTDISVQFCEQVFEGRMTGGGSWIGMVGTDGEEVKVTNGFTLHCDITLSNNLEINWAGNRWHIEKENIVPFCWDNELVDPEPPPAPFDTFEGEAIGYLNGEWGSRIEFVLVDYGEPGGKNDRGAMIIWDKDGNQVLEVEEGQLSHGNLQAHYDQPHGCNVNKPCF